MKQKSILILWDLDGTLMHCGADGTAALNLTFQQLYGADNAFSKAGIGSAMDSVILDSIMEGLNCNKGELPHIKETYIENLKLILEGNENKRILPGIKELLEYISNSEVCFNALLTSNLRLGAEAKLCSVGLGGYFSTGGFGDDYGEKWDAAKTGIREAEKHFGVHFDNENIYVIGDSPYDIQAAKRLGLQSIAVATGWKSQEVLAAEKPDFLFSDFSDYESVLTIFGETLSKKDDIRNGAVR